jgi:hypothetical protein
VARLLSSLAGIAEARARSTVRRLGLRAMLVAGCVAAGLLASGFGLAAATVALAGRVGVLPALGIMAAAAIVVLLALLAALAIEARRHRRIAAERARLDRQLYRAAALAAAPRVAPRLSRTAIGLGLVGIGALLVLMRRD